MGPWAFAGTIADGSAVVRSMLIRPVAVLMLNQSGFVGEDREVSNPYVPEIRSVKSTVLLLPFSTRFVAG